VASLAQTAGELKWQVRSPNPSVFSLAGTLGTNGLIYGTAWPDLIAWDAASGALLWSTNMDGRPLDYPGSLVVGPEGNVYVNTTEGLEAFNGTTGAKLWTSRAHGPISIGPDGTLYVTAGNLEAVDPVTGNILWTSFSSDTSSYAPIVLGANGRGYIGEMSDGSILAVDLRSGGEA